MISFLGEASKTLTMKIGRNNGIVLHLISTSKHLR